MADKSGGRKPKAYTVAPYRSCQQLLHLLVRREAQRVLTIHVPVQASQMEQQVRGRGKCCAAGANTQCQRHTYTSMSQSARVNKYLTIFGYL